MKDVQGIHRGKCNAPGCECEEYRTSSGDDRSSSGASGRFRCEYCDHTPVQHVKIIELGECRACGKDNCEKYEFEDPNSYQNCAYCDCPASAHAGSEKLRKPTPQQQQQQQMSAFQGGFSAGGMPASATGGGMVAAPGMGGFQPRTDAFGQPIQSVQFGTCKFPGCQFPKRIEGNKVHDFCSRTCAKKFSQLPPQMQGGGPIAASSGQMMMGQGQPVIQQGGGMHGGYGQQQMTQGGGGPSAAGMPLQKTAGSGSTPQQSGMATTSYQSSFITVTKGQAAPMTVCRKCQKMPANPGHSWCQSCYVNKS